MTNEEKIIGIQEIQIPELIKKGVGTDQLILSAVPAHRADLILRKVDVDRYGDRLPRTFFKEALANCFL